MNTISITGRLTDNPELKTTQNGVSVCQCRLAVKRPKVKDTTDFLTVVSWRKGAEYLATYGRKGDMVAVTGVLTARNWEDRDGHKRTAYEVVCDNVSFVDPKSANPGGGYAAPDSQIPPAYNESQPAFSTASAGDFEEIVGDDELPF